MFPGGWTLQQSKKNRRNQADQTKFLKTILTCEGVLRFVDVFVLHKTPQGVGVEHSFLNVHRKLLQSMMDQQLQPVAWLWWIAIEVWCGFHTKKVVELVYVWWLPESYDLKYTVEVWIVMEIGKILFPNRSMPRQNFPKWTPKADLWCGPVETGEISLLHLTANLQQKCSQVVCGCFHLFVVQPSCHHKKQVIS